MHCDLQHDQEIREFNSPLRSVFCPLPIFCLLAIVFVTNGFAADTFDQSIRPLLRDYCVSCHSTEKQEGEFDLERFDSLDHVKEDADAWERVQEQLALGEMPPKDAKQLSADQKSQLVGWVQTTLNEIALANAGDPGPVVLRRLSNHEYTYTLRDLTGVHTLDPAREFPVDGAAGEGFTNVGSALVMSPALLSKYLDAAKEVSQHAVLLPDGIRFSASTSPRDWTDETLARLREFYSQHTSRVSGDQVQLQGIDLDMGTGEGHLPLAKYLMTLQGHAMEEGLSRKYLEILRTSMESSEPSMLLDPLRTKFRERTLTAADIEMWQKVLWKFSLVGHIGRPSGPKAWQEPVDPFATQQEFRVKLEGTQDHRIHLVARTAGDGSDGDRVQWENPKLVAKDRPEIPVTSLPELQDYLQKRRDVILENAQQCLATLAAEQSKLAGDSDSTKVVSDRNSVDPELLKIWREYLGLRETQEVVLEPLLPTKIERVPDYGFVQGWTAGEDLSILANPSDNTVRIPGTMAGHSVMVHPSPSRASVVAWRSPVSGTLRIAGRVVDAHTDCGDGVAWEIQVRRGRHTQQLASGITEGGKEYPLGPFEDVRIQSGQVVVLVIRPQSNHSCDATTLDFTLSDGTSTWDLAKDVSSNILQGNPHGPWHFLSEAAQGPQVSILPAPMASWCEEPSAERALQVHDFLRDNFPLTHPLLVSDLRKFLPSQPSEPLTMEAPGTVELKIPADLAEGAELVVTGKLDVGSSGSVQLQVLSSKPDDSLDALIPGVPVVVADNSVARERLQKSFDEFRSLFPITLCYSRIVPVDEVVTLRLYYREDKHLQRLILDEKQFEELDRIWNELLFVSQAPLKQVDAFEQIYQFATQDRADLVVEFEKMREPIHQAAEEFQQQQQAAETAHREAVIDLAARAWRRPLTEQEKSQLLNMPPRLMLVRVLTSPAFLYRSETPGSQTGPINDWELATRLSYFLWSSTPDDELSQLAAAGKLRDPDLLVAQASRMLKDDRVRRLATEFGCQYLHVRDVAALDEKSERHFPTFKPLREAMQEEVTRFYIDLFQNDRSVLSLLDADHTFLNKPLAEHYGIPFEGTDWQRVEGIKQHGRGGALGFSATLARHSGASRTSAILRGTWVSEVLLGDKIPNPPKGVPTLPEVAPEGLNERQLIERHSSDARCAGCHKRIDPFGFALEGFDAIGRYRSADTKTVVFDGTSIDGLAGLREYLANKRRDDFLQQFGRKLLGYALGRSSQLSDQPLIDRLTSTEGGRIGKMIEQIVRSPQFREIRGKP
jgi:Protein of unknown function (DUF1592)/Protein of unknown function (DUF1588)/Protein of unknown function (DUF1587)/Protein of unknown function (DUF1585)/Planctomycete cytochrome C